MSIYEMMRAIGHPIDLLGNPINKKLDYPGKYSIIYV